MGVKNGWHPRKVGERTGLKVGGIDRRRTDVASRQALIEISKGRKEARP